MADIGAENWSETDSSNTTAAPDGAPEGMAPSGVNNVLRAHQGAVKRFYDHINAVKTTGGTSTAYTLSYDVAPASYYDGELFTFIVNATNGASATLNINSLGAVSLRLFGGALLAGALLADQVVTARYNLSAGAFDIIPQHGWVRLGTQDPSAAANVDFTSIPAGVNNLMVSFDWVPSTDGVAMAIQTYGADGVLDTGASDYSYGAVAVFGNDTTDTFGDDANNGIGISHFSNTIDSSAGIGIGGTIHLSNIQALHFTKATFSAAYRENSVSTFASVTGCGWRSEADRITGLRFFFSSGTGTGKFTLFASA